MRTKNVFNNCLDFYFICFQLMRRWCMGASALMGHVFSFTRCSLHLKIHLIYCPDAHMKDDIFKSDTNRNFLINLLVIRLFWDSIYSVLHYMRQIFSLEFEHLPWTLKCKATWRLSGYHTFKLWYHFLKPFTVFCRNSDETLILIAFNSYLFEGFGAQEDLY